MPFHMPSVFAFRFDVALPVLVPCVLGAAAVFLLLPKASGGRTALIGALLGGLGLLLAAYLLLHVGMFSPETVLFYAFSALAIVAGVLLVTQRNPARAALSFALVILSTCGLFLLLAAPFLMAATIIIYAGAIIVTFLFVLMLASQAGINDADARTREPLLATALGFLLLGCLIYVLQVSYEQNETVRVIDKLLLQTEAKRAKLNPETQSQFKTTFIEVLRADVQKNGNDNELRTIDRFIEDLNDDIAANWPETQPVPVETINEMLMRLEAFLVRARQLHGWLPPRPPDKGLASDLSGPPGTQDIGWRTDDQGRPYLPADNSAFLGRSLFTDFLLPVELGGVLLLVATVGAIAIANRRSTPARPT